MLCCLVTPGLSKDFQCRVVYCKSPETTLATSKWAVSMMIADGCFSIAEEFMWVCMG